MSGPPTEIYSAANSQQAYLLKGLLEERGIAAWVVNDAIQIAGGELPVGWRAAPKVVVGLEDAPEARKIAEDFDQRTSESAEAEELTQQAAAGDTWEDWPRCPQCGERRCARCTVCGAPGTNFRLADVEESTNNVRVLLICEACDDHFLPEWFRVCPRCGHDYADGIEVDSITSPLGTTNPALWVVVGLLVLLIGIVISYFRWVLR